MTDAVRTNERGVLEEGDIGRLRRAASELADALQQPRRGLLAASSDAVRFGLGDSLVHCGLNPVARRLIFFWYGRGEDGAVLHAELPVGVCSDTISRSGEDGLRYSRKILAALTGSLTFQGTCEDSKYGYSVIIGELTSYPLRGEKNAGKSRVFE